MALLRGKHLVACYAGGLAAGIVGWWVTGEPWYGVGVTVAVMAIYTFLLAGRLAPPRRGPAADAATPPDSRQRRRQAERQQRKRASRP